MIEKKHYYGIDWLRAFSCIGIMMMHIAANNNYQINGFVYQTIIPSFTNFVFLFMVISSFGMCCGYFEKVKSGNINWIDFYKKRYLKVLPFFSLLVVIDILMNRNLSSLVDAIPNLTLTRGLFANQIEQIGVAWFLGLIFAFYLIFPFFCVLISKKSIAWISFFISLLLNWNLGTYFGIERTNIVYSFCYFLAGGLVYLYKDKLKNIKWYVLLQITILSIIIYYMIGCNTFTCLFASVMLLIQFIVIDMKKIKLISFISNISMEIYLSHMVVFRMIEKLHLNTMFGSGWLQYIVTTFLVLIGTICFSYIVKTFIEFSERKLLKS